MSAINYQLLSDDDKLGLLQLLYHDLKHKEKKTKADFEHIETIVRETQKVYNRIKQRGN